MVTRLVLRGNVIEPIVEVDNKIVPCKKDKVGNRIYDIQTESNFCELKIYTLKHELSEPYWWLFAFLFYVVSICGLLNTFYSKKFYYLNYVGVLNATYPVLDLQFNMPKDNIPALNPLNGQFDNNATNVYAFDSKAKKRKRLCFWLKILSWIAIVATIVVVMILK